MGLVIEILPMIFSLIMGAATTHWKQKAEDLHRERMHALRATEAARKDQSRHTSWSRKFIVQSVIGSLFLFPMALTVMNYLGSFTPGYVQLGFYVPQEVLNGGLLSFLWSEKAVEYVPIYGFVFMPIHMLIAQTITGYYFGASAMKR